MFKGWDFILAFFSFTHVLQNALIMKSIRPNRNRKHYTVSQALKNQSESLQKVSEALKANLKVYPINPKFV